MLALVSSRNNLSNFENEEIEVTENKIDQKYVKRLVKRSRPRIYERRLDFAEARETLPVAEEDTDLCVLLWQSVILQALYDLAGDLTQPDSRILQAEAMSWFFVQSRDFNQVCSLANVPAYKVIAAAKRVVKEGETALEGFNFRTLRKPSSDRQPIIRRKK